MPLTLKNFYKQGWTPDPSRTIFYYDFEDSNNRLKDTSGNNNNATGASGVTYIEVIGQYVAEISTTGGYVAIDGTVGGSIGSGDFTVSFRHYPVSPSGNYPMMFGIFSNDHPYNGPQLFFDPDNRRGLGNHFIYRCSGGTGYPGSATASNYYNTRNHFVMIRNSGTVTCYLNGVQDCTWSGDTGALPSSNAGGYIVSRNSGSQQNFPAGAMGDKFILENVGWSATDVSKYFNQTKSLYGIS